MSDRPGIYLLLGRHDDPCCSAVSAALEASGYPVRVVSNPLAHPMRFTWWLDSTQSGSRVAWGDNLWLSDDEIAGVLVGTTVRVESAGWHPEDLAYMRGETQAALLGWLWSLNCPVINRYPASMWAQPNLPLLYWHPLLWRCGLPPPAWLVSNVEHEARAFGLGHGGVVYAPITGTGCYLIADHEQWEGLAAVQRQVPVSLTRPHASPRIASVVGHDIVWDGAPPVEASTLESRLRQLSFESGLAFVRVAIAQTSEGLRTVAVEPGLNLEGLRPVAQQRVVAGLVRLLTAPPTHDARGAGAPGRASRLFARSPQ